MNPSVITQQRAITSSVTFEKSTIKSVAVQGPQW